MTTAPSNIPPPLGARPLRLTMREREDLESVTRRVKAAQIKLARVDPARFCEYVLRDEETGAPIAMTEMHEEWHDLVTQQDRVIIWSHLEAGKTSQLSIGRSLYELGRDPTRRIVILGNTHSNAAKVTGVIQRYLTESKELRDVFPHLLPGSPWSTDKFSVRRKTFSKDASVQACGANMRFVGGRIDDLIIDDVLDLMNTLTEEQREKLIHWFLSTFPGRISKRGRILVVGNAYHPKDLLHFLRDKRRYEHRTYPVERTDGSIRFPARWTPERVAAKRLDLGPVEAARQLDCVARDEASSRCKDEWIQKCLTRGLDVPIVHSITPEQLTAMVPGGWVGVGVDLGVKKKKSSGKTVFFAILFHPDGTRQVLEVKSGKFSARDILITLLDFHTRYGALVFVEDNGAQDFLIQLASEDAPDAGMWVIPFNTGANKAHPVFGVEGIFAEFARGAWIIPSVEQENAKGELVPVAATSELAEWLSECAHYNPNGHTGDHLMAAWIGKEAARLAAIEIPTVGARVLGKDSDDARITATPEERKADLSGWEAVIKKRRT